MEIQLERVIPTSTQTHQLFHQLEHRLHRISHECLPSFDNHVSFVENNPYRAWFIVKRGAQDLGNVYVQFDNSIGLHLPENVLSDELKDLLRLLYFEIEPLIAIPSVRYKDYFLNVASTNFDLQHKLVTLGIVKYKDPSFHLNIHPSSLFQRCTFNASIIVISEF